MRQGQNKILSEEEIFSYLKSKNPNLSDTALKWEFFNYVKKGALIKVGKKRYIREGRKYSYNYQSQVTKDLDNYLTSYFGEINVVLWECMQLNEWLNFLLATNIIFVEVEKEFVDFVFSGINDVFGKTKIVLLNPDDDTLSRYLRNDLIVVNTLYSKSPKSHSDKKIKLEKLVVDVFCDDFPLDSNGKYEVIKGIKNNYDIDVDNMLAYASRRRVKNDFLKLWDDKDD